MFSHCVSRQRISRCCRTWPKLLRHRPIKIRYCIHTIPYHTIPLHYITYHYIPLHYITLHIYIYKHAHKHAYVQLSNSVSNIIFLVNSAWTQRRRICKDIAWALIGRCLYGWKKNAGRAPIAIKCHQKKWENEWTWEQPWKSEAWRHQFRVNQLHLKTRKNKCKNCQGLPF